MSQHEHGIANTICAICETNAGFTSFDAPDFHYGNPGTYTYRCCANCGVISRYPLPDETSLMSLYPETYYAHVAQHTTPITSAGWGRGLKSILVSQLFKSMFLNKGYTFDKQPNLFLRSFWTIYIRLTNYNRMRGIPPKDAGKRYLDFGSGATGTVAWMQELGWNASGLDVSERAARAGRAAGLDIHPGTAHDNPWLPETFDYIYSSHAFEHVIDPEGTLLALADLLRPGGQMYIVQPNAAGFCARAGAKWSGLTAPVHIHLHTPQSMRILAHKAELEVISMWQDNNNHDVINTILLLLGRNLKQYAWLRRNKLAMLGVSLLSLPLVFVGQGCDLGVLLKKPA